MRKSIAIINNIVLAFGGVIGIWLLVNMDRVLQMIFAE